MLAAARLEHQVPERTPHPHRSTIRNPAVTYFEVVPGNRRSSTEHQCAQLGLPKRHHNIKGRRMDRKGFWRDRGSEGRHIVIHLEEQRFGAQIMRRACNSDCGRPWQCMHILRTGGPKNQRPGLLLPKGDGDIKVRIVDDQGFRFNGLSGHTVIIELEEQILRRFAPQNDRAFLVILSEAKDLLSSGARADSSSLRSE